MDDRPSFFEWGDDTHSFRHYVPRGDRLPTTAAFAVGTVLLFAAFVVLVGGIMYAVGFPLAEVLPFAGLLGGISVFCIAIMVGGHVLLS